jgi:iron complex outermembrane receptor protein
VLTGAQMANTPKWIGTLSYAHDWAIERGVLTFRAAMKLSGGYFATVDEWYGGAYQSSYHSSDLYLNYGTDNGHWGLGLWVKNLENDAQKTYIFPFFRAELTSPRTYGGTVSYRFD